MCLPLYAIIIAGGKGVRFWPVSRQAYPKQFLALAGKRSFLQQTVARILPLIKIKQTLVVTGAKHLHEVLINQLPNLSREQILLEPVPRNTAAAIALACLWIASREPKAVCLILPSDHLITDEALFLAALTRAAKLAWEEDVLVTLGIVPRFAATGFGYIEISDILDTVSPQVSVASGFHEKPDYITAQAYLTSGRYLWNSGIFAWRVEIFLEELFQYQPEMFSRLTKLPFKLDQTRFDEKLAEIYYRLPIISIDRAILEKTKKLRVIKGEFGWIDVGSWDAMDNLWPADEAGNINCQGRVLGIDAKNNIVSVDNRLTALLGVNDLVVVLTKDVLLIASRHRCQDISKIIELLETKGLYEYI